MYQGSLYPRSSCSDFPRSMNVNHGRIKSKILFSNIKEVVKRTIKQFMLTYRINPCLSSKIINTGYVGPNYVSQKGEKEIKVFILLSNHFTSSLARAFLLTVLTAQKMKFSIKDFFSKCDQIRSLLRIWSNLLKKSLMENIGLRHKRVNGVDSSNKFCD